MALDLAELSSALAAARQSLLNERTPGGWWEGELSSSALSTATAIVALSKLTEDGEDETCRRLIDAGLDWLALNQNSDGGWGDTPKSLSNISTTALCWAALAIDARKGAPAYGNVNAAAERWLTQHAGGIDRAHLAPAIIARYGKDKTFSVPILTCCALSGRFGQGPLAWRDVPQLPFEAAAFPQRWFKWLKLPVVSYALPALIAIGLVRHVCRPSWNPVARLLRRLVRPRVLNLLGRIQPATGGFLEATPLTSFVLMSLVGAGEGRHPVVGHGLEFLIRSARPDGSWAIDTNLATWVTTLAVSALYAGDGADATNAIDVWTREDRQRARDWLLAQQYQVEHPYTLADPGAWAWTPLPGGVPDADDTPGALLALAHLTSDQHVRAAPKLASVAPLGAQTEMPKTRATPTPTPVLRYAEEPASPPLSEVAKPPQSFARAGLRWLLYLQNRDGGIPTFCKGWGTLPFDRSSADLTAHFLRAMAAWNTEASAADPRGNSAIARGREFLIRAQRPDGSWLPLWFGNQHAPDDENPTYGTARVLLAHGAGDSPPWRQSMTRGAQWLLANQRPDGGWGAGGDTPASIEETALAVEALAHVMRHSTPLCEALGIDQLRQAIEHGAAWLIAATDGGQTFDPTPIGFYFAKLWYFERLYPLAFTVAALHSAQAALALNDLG